MQYLNPSRFAAKCTSANDVQFVNYVEACLRSANLTTDQKKQWITTALKAEANEDEPRQHRISKLNQKRYSLSD